MFEIICLPLCRAARINSFELSVILDFRKFFSNIFGGDVFNVPLETWDEKFPALRIYCHKIITLVEECQLGVTAKWHYRYNRYYSETLQDLYWKCVLQSFKVKCYIKSFIESLRMVQSVHSDGCSQILYKIDPSAHYLLE